MRRAALLMAAVLIGLVVVVGARDASACMTTSPPEHRIDGAAKQMDRVAPSTPVLDKVMVTRGRAGSGGSCADRAMVEFRLRATDDRSRPFQLGYRFRIVSGALPGTGAAVVPTAALRASGGVVWLHWPESALDLPPFDVTFEITAIDFAGNASMAPLIVRVTDDGFATPRASTFTMTTATAGCEGGAAAACTWLGKRYAHGVDVARDAARAAALYDKACLGGDALACHALAVMRHSRQGDGGAEYVRLEAESVRLNTDGCRIRGDAGACFERGWQAARRGEYDERGGYWLDACERGLVEACRDYQWLARDPSDAARARLAAALQKRCDQQHDADICFYLASQATEPRHVRRLMDRACRAGSSRACVAQADHALGEDPHAAAGAAAIYTKACAREASEQDCLLAEALTTVARSKSSTSDVIAALSALEANCHFNRALCAHMALRYERGVLVGKDAGRAKALRERACHMGHAPSCLRLAEVILAARTDGNALVEAAEALDATCSGADVPSCLAMGKVCTRLAGLGTEPGRHSEVCRGTRLRDGLELARANLAACDVGAADLCFRAARLFARAGAVADASAAAAKGCAAGDQQACRFIAPKLRVSGTITDVRTGKGHAALAVRVTTDGEPDDLCMREVATDARGAFVVANVCAGAVRVRATNGFDQVVALGVQQASSATVFALRTLPLEAPKGLPPGELGLQVEYGVSRLADLETPIEQGTIADLARQDDEVEEIKASLFIKSVRPGGPASRAGLQVGDRVIAVDGHAVAINAYDPSAMTLYLASGRAGQAFVVEVNRRGKRIVVKVVAERVAPSK